MKSSAKSGDAVPLEHIEQVSMVNWLSRTYPSILFFAIPNGGLRHATVAEKLKREGVLPGVPDLFVPEWQLFIEMKRRKCGRVSQEQKDVMQQLENAGYSCIVGYGYEDAQKKVLQHLKTTGRMQFINNEATEESINA